MGLRPTHKGHWSSNDLQEAHCMDLWPNDTRPVAVPQCTQLFYYLWQSWKCRLRKGLLGHPSEKQWSGDRNDPIFRVLEIWFHSAGRALLKGWVMLRLGWRAMEVHFSKHSLNTLNTLWKVNLFSNYKTE